MYICTKHIIKTPRTQSGFFSALHYYINFGLPEVKLAKVPALRQAPLVMNYIKKKIQS